MTKSEPFQMRITEQKICGNEMIFFTMFEEDQLTKKKKAEGWEINRETVTILDFYERIGLGFKYQIPGEMKKWERAETQRREENETRRQICTILNLLAALVGPNVLQWIERQAHIGRYRCSSFPFFFV